MLMRRRPQLARFAVIVLAMASLLAVCLWLTVFRIPSYYKPPQVGPAEYQAVRDNLEAAYNDLNLAVQGSDEFDYVVEQDQLNRWIAARRQIWPGFQRYVPEKLDQPMVVFQDGRLVVSGLAPAAGFRSVLTLILSLRAEPDHLTVRLEGCRIGAVPVPRHALGRFLDRLESSSTLPHGASPQELLEGLTIPNRFEWRSGGRLIRFEQIDLKAGRLVARIAPAPNRRVGKARR
jgi:hypothetical protein